MPARRHGADTGDEPPDTDARCRSTRSIEQHPASSSRFHARAGGYGRGPPVRAGGRRTAGRCSRPGRRRPRVRHERERPRRRLGRAAPRHARRRPRLTRPRFIRHGAGEACSHAGEAVGGRRRGGAPDRGCRRVLAERPAGRRRPLLDRHGRLGRRLPGLRRRARRADDRRARRRAHHGGDDVGVGRQPDARRAARLRHRLHAVRHGDRRRQGAGRLRPAARPARARDDLPEHHAGRGQGRLGHRADRGPGGQDGLRRLARTRAPR